MAFHFHGPGFAEVITGRKLFLLYPPGSDVNVPPNLTMATWVEKIYPSVQRTQLKNPAYEDSGTPSPSPAAHEASGNIYHEFSGESGDIKQGKLMDDVEQAGDFAGGRAAHRGSDSNGDCSASMECSDANDSATDPSIDVRVPPSATLESFYECVLEPGDMLYFPNSWMHATLNLDQFNLFVSVFLDLQLMRS